MTTNYVGPDRRRDPTRPSDIELFEPPNSLKMKAKERLTPEMIAQRLEQEIRVARSVMNSEKLRRDAFQACIQWRLTCRIRCAGQASYDEQLSLGRHVGALHFEALPRSGHDPVPPRGASPSLPPSRGSGAWRGSQRLHAPLGTCSAEPEPRLLPAPALPTSNWPRLTRRWPSSVPEPPKSWRPDPMSALSRRG